MNNNIDKMINKILESDELCEKLIKKSTLQEAYDFCVSIHGGYTIEELEEFLEDNSDNEYFVEDLDDMNIENVAGGVSGKTYTKLLSCSLAALTALTPVPQIAVSAAESNATKSTTTSAKKSSKKLSFWEKYKKYIIGSGIAGSVILGIGLMYYCSKNNIQFPLSGRKEQKSKKGGTGEASTNDTSTNDTSTDDTGTDEKSTVGKNKKSEASDNWYKQIKKFINDKFFTASKPFQGANDFISDLSSLSKKLATIGGATWTVNRLWNRFVDFKKFLEKKINKQELSLNDAFGNLDLLFEEVKGQKTAKKQIKNIVYGILHRKNQAKINGKKYDHGDVLYFAGPSGVGKTLMAKGLANYKILTANAEPFYISASEVDKESSETVVEQLFGLNKSFGGGYYGGFGDLGLGGFGGSERNVITKPKNLVKYLNENSDGIVIVDEYDKMWSPALDEVFRTIVDKGVINVKGQTIDCSGITFILTSNESTRSLTSGNQDISTGIDDDGTGSRTIVKHDKSFINRLQPVEFENLSLNEYEKIIEKEIRQDLIEYWADPETSGVNVIIDDECLKNMATVVRKKNQGARYITKLQSALFRDITLKTFEGDKKQKDFYRGKKLFVHFNPDNEEFTVSDTE